MFTIRNLGGAALLLFGTTFLWLTPTYAASGIDTSGAAWTATAVLAIATLVGFTAATWGLFRRTSWWEKLAVVSALVGLLTLVPYWVAADGSGVTTPGFDVAIHAIGSAGVLVLLRVPRFDHWVRGHVAAGR